MSIFKHHNAPRLESRHSGDMTPNDPPNSLIGIVYAWFAASIAQLCELVASVGTTLAGLTLAQWVQVVALVYTLLQAVFLLRDKWWRDPKRKRMQRRSQYDRSNKQ